MARLTERGLVEGRREAAGPPSPALTGRGRSLRQEVEDATDRLAAFPYGALGEEARAELRTLSRPFSVAVVEAAGLGR